MKIAVIPARGGSKRIPRKNIKEFFGKPMIAWSIEAAKQSNIFDRIIVSTDDKEIAEIAEQYGAEVPFMRPDTLADDFAPTIPVIAHAIEEMKNSGCAVEYACCIYATAPFIQTSDIVAGYEEINTGDWAYTFSVTDFSAPIFRSFEILETGGIQMFYPEHFETRSQDLPEAFHDAGQFYWGTADAWLDGKRFFEPYSKPIVVPRWRVQDIDTIADWERAQLIAKSIL